MTAADEVIEVNREELQALLERKREALGEEDYQKLKDLLRVFNFLADKIGEKDTTISQAATLGEAWQMWNGFVIFTRSWRFPQVRLPASGDEVGEAVVDCPANLP